MDVDEHLQGNCEYHHILLLTCKDDEKEPVFACETEKDFFKWKEALQQALVDLRAWKQAYKCDIVLTGPTPRKLPMFSRLSLYDQIDVEITLEEDLEEGRYKKPLNKTWTDFMGGGEGGGRRLQSTYILVITPKTKCTPL